MSLYDVTVGDEEMFKPVNNLPSLSQLLLKKAVPPICQ